MNFKRFSRSLEHFFLTVGRTILVTKYHFCFFQKKNTPIDMGLDVTEEEILAVMNFLPEREIYKVLNIESFVTRAAIHGSYTLGPENLSTCNRIYISLQFYEQVFLIPYFHCLHFEINYLSNWHFFEHLIISEVKSVNNLPTSCNFQKVNKKIRGLELPVLMSCLS